VIGCSDFLEQALLETGRLTSESLATARATAAEDDVSVEEAIVALGLVGSIDLAIVKAGVVEAPFVDLTNYEIDYGNASLLPRTVAETYTLYPLFDLDGVLTVGMIDPLNLKAIDQVRQHVRHDVEAVLCEAEQLRGLIGRAYRLNAGAETGSSLEETASEAGPADDAQPVVAAVNQLIGDAIEYHASDIHLNPDDHDLHLRLRIDGALQTHQGPALSMHAAIVQRLKVMARLDLTQTRRPQDGKFRFAHQGQDYDIRLSTIPTVNGENVVMRVLRPHTAILDFARLGLSPSQVEMIEEWISQPYGMVLVTGPTGSGKTTTLYTALHQLNEPHRNIMTVEDPVEIRLPLVRQVQVNHEIELTFASALRSILRQDPDVVLVGEIRDGETASIAMQASLTGHLVLSTLHTNDATGAVSRLHDLGVPPFMVNSSLIGVLAQRLVRRVCEHCVESYTPDDLVRRRFELEHENGQYQRGRGCARCLQTGYHGRAGIYELLPMNPEIKQLIERHEGAESLRQAVAGRWLRPMWQDGVEKARMGVTTLEEVAKVVSVHRARMEESNGEALRRSA
jgi:type IV pilus assembly protein PilB